MTTEQIEKGTKLIAIDECKMDENEENALIIGKSYVVNSANRLYITINSEIDEMHQFYRTELHEFFKVNNGYGYVQCRQTSTKLNTK